MTRCVINMHSSAGEELLLQFWGQIQVLQQRSKLKKGNAHVVAGQEFPKGVSSGGACLFIGELWKCC